MASPTWAEKWTQISNAVEILDETLDFGNADTTNLVGMVDTHNQAIEGDFAAESAAAVDNMRTAYAELLTASAARRILEPHFLDLGKVIGSRLTDFDRLLDDVFDYMITNTEKLNSRNITFGAVSAAGGNTGDGTVYRLTTDVDSETIEAVHLDVVTAKCVQDQNTGTEPGRELFEIYHGDPGPDVLELRGSGEFVVAQALAGDVILSNASFGDLDGTLASPNSIPGWTLDTGTLGTDLQLSATAANVFRTGPEETTARSLYVQSAADFKLSQKISTIGEELDRDAPYLLLVRYKGDGSRDGNLDIRFGSNEATVAVTGSTWKTLVLTINQNMWPDNAYEADLNIEIETDSSTAGEMYIDDLVLARGTRFDNLWYWVVGAATDFKADDSFTFTDTLAGSEAKIQYWMWRAFGRYFPSTTTGTDITISDPS